MSSDITALTPEKLAEIRQRYSPVAAPKCRLCGVEMSIGAMSAARTVYACSGAMHDDNGWHYAPGRSLADDHYAQSRVTVVDVSDPDVLALVEALEKAQQHEQEWRSLCEAAAVDLDDWREIDDKSRGLICKMADVIIARNERIAELESRAVMLPRRAGAKSSWQDGPLMHADEVIAALASAGIQVIEGEQKNG